MGFCYVASTEGYIKEAEISISSLRRVMPNAQIAMVAPRHLWRRDLLIDQWIDLPAGLPAAPIVKTSARLAPYERVIFIDTDTYVAGDLSDLFRLLDNFDLAVAHEPTRGWDYTTSAPLAFCELNTGVIVFRNDARVGEFFTTWEKQFAIMRQEQELTNDQPSFRTTLWENSDLRFTTLPSEYHLICGKPVAIAWEARLLHSRGNIEQMASVINGELGPRIFVEGWGILRGYRGRRLWIADYLTLTRNFLRVLLRPTSLQSRRSPVAWGAKKCPSNLPI